MVIIVLGMLMLDAVIYLLLELLLQGYTYDYSPGGGSKNQVEVGHIAKMINTVIYIWHALNLTAILVLMYKITSESQK